ncbi:hypothetical protein OROGR_009069 [Orobanche gracilis]
MRICAKQSKVVGDEFLIKYWDIENVNLLTTTNANGGLMAMYNKITKRSRCFAFVTVNNSRSRCSSSSWLSGSFYNTETESSLGGRAVNEPSHSFQQAEDALTRNGKTLADFDPMCY